MNKQISILAVLAIMAVGLGVWLSQSPSKDVFEPEQLFEDLQQFANQLDSVEIENAQGVLFSAKKVDDSWLATFDPKQPPYPVSQEKLAAFVDTMMRLKLVEAKTSKPQNFIRLGLQSIDEDDSLATLVTFNAASQSWQVLVGNNVSLGEGNYVLKPGDTQSWRTDISVDLPIDHFSWLQQPALPLLAEDIRSVSRVDSVNWQIIRSANGDFQLVDLPKGRALEYDSILSAVVNNLTSLNFESLLVAEEDFAQSLTQLSRLEVVTADNRIFQVVVSELDDKHFVKFNASEQSEYWQKWYYQVSNFSAQQLVKTVEDFLAAENAKTNNNEASQTIVDEGESPF